MVHSKRRSLFCGLGLVLALATGCTGKSKPVTPELRVMTWADYLRDDLVKDFEKEHGAKVILDYFSSNEELLAKVQASASAGGRGYDLILPSDYMVTSMVRLKLLNPIDKSRLGFLNDFDPLFLHPSYDKDLSYCVPFAIGTTGVAVNTKLAPKFDFSKGVSWKDLLENPAFKGKATLLDDQREVIQTALIILGKSWEKATEDDIKAAFEYLKKHKSNLKIFTAEARPVIQNDECTLCQAYSGDVHLTAASKPEIKYFIPKEGATIWSDNWAMPVNARNTELAYAFLNKILSKEGGAKFTNATYYPTANMKAMELVRPDIRDNRAVYPDAATRARLSFIPERPELLKLVDRLWTELKSQ